MRDTLHKCLVKIESFLYEVTLKFPKDDKLLEEKIKHYTRAYSLELYNHLHNNLKEEFEDHLTEEALKRLLFFFRTHHGSQDDYWYPLFLFLTHKERAENIGRKVTKKEEDFWDSIIPFCYRCLKKHDKKIEEIIKQSIRRETRAAFFKNPHSVGLLQLNMDDLSITLSTKGVRTEGLDLYEGFSEKWKTNSIFEKTR